MARLEFLAFLGLFGADAELPLETFPALCPWTVEEVLDVRAVYKTARE